MDHSELQSYMDCQQKYHLKFNEQLSKIEEGVESYPSVYGQAIHAGLAAYYKGQGIEEAKKVFLQHYANPLHEENIYTHESGVFLLANYEKWAKANDTEWKVLQVEVADEFTFNGVAWTVKIDLIVESPSGIWVVDHKTTGRLNQWFWPRFDMSGQMTGYCEYVKQKYGECSGFWINGIGLGYAKRAVCGDPDSPEEMAEAERYMMQELKYSKYYGKEMVFSSGFHYRFERQNFSRLPQQTEAWKEDTQRWITKLKASQQFNSWPRNTSMCNWCEFKEICMAAGDAQIKELMYEKKDPRAYLKEDENVTQDT